MMGFIDLPLNLWGYALEAVAYLLNKVPTKQSLQLHVRYGKERNQVLNTSRSGVALLILKDCKQINLRQGLISVDSLVILKKEWDIIFTNLLTIKCLWQEEQPFWKENFL